MKKALICIVLIAVATVAWLIWGTSDAAAIDKVIEQCNRIEEWDQDSSDKAENLLLLRRTITKLRAINTNHCPQEFCDAFEHFIQTLENFYVLAIDAPENIFSGMASIFTGWASKAEWAIRQCENAHAEVNQIAAKYGAKNRLKDLE